MADPKDDERDEEWFKEVYGKEYTGPAKPGNDIARDNTSSKKRPMTQASGGESEEDNGLLDPNAVPTDFTSREAKVWEAKAKAIERNWKKKKEDELTCRICGEYGHFPQGCPTTLGANRKKSEIVERIPVKDKRLKPRIIGTGGVTIQGIEKDTGCRLQLEDNLAAGNGSFSVRITGSNRVMVGRAVEAVKNLIDQVQGERKPHDVRRTHGSQSHGVNMSPLMAAQMQHIANQRVQQDSNMPPHPGQDGPYGMEQMSQLEARRQWESENLSGPYPMNPYEHKGGSQYDDNRVNPKGSGSAKEHDHGPEADVGYDQQQSMPPRTLEELEYKFVQETMQLSKEVNDAEDKENARHREAMRDIQEQYQQKTVALRAQQAQRREEFLRQEAQIRQQQYPHYQQLPSGPNFYNYDVAGGAMPGFNGGAREHQLGYGMGAGDRKEGYGGYGSTRGDEGYYNSSNTGRSFRAGGYDNQAYDAGPYRY